MTDTPKQPDAPKQPEGPQTPDAPAVPETRKEIPLEVIGRRQGMFGAHGSGDTSGFGGLAAAIVLPAPAERPYGGWFDEVADELEGALEEQGLDPAVVIEKTVVDRAELTFQIAREHLLATVRTLRDDPALRFELCLGVSGVHYPGEAGRELHAVYHLRSITHTRLIRIEVTAPDADPRIPSVVSVYPTNDWHEREAYDFFGIVFEGHPALTRIMMPDDWLGHPQRKDYPLGGIPVEYKGAQIPAPDQRRSYS
ncbi:NADH-quinone oxidoreductase subunit C [Kitasatospora sp. NBC_01250]|uniref:NADH-quinone oxidoreductase subunit C n=1 Tax=Kitasatospora sp. NBC_01250 TaxID=2903571 RepID=UPI002E2ECCB8|nr:NADH-quinone oxidoreductase subunit C [Kitasatospora sp. NBC_01250]